MATRLARLGFFRPRHPFRKNSMLTNRTASRQAHLRSHWSKCRSRFLACANDSGVQFRVLLLERLQLPLPWTEATCNGWSRWTHSGRHRAACTRTRRIKKRSSPTERVTRRPRIHQGATLLPPPPAHPGSRWRTRAASHPLPESLNVPHLLGAFS